MKTIFVYEPDLSGKETEYVNSCLSSTWISSKGPFIEKFENEFSNYTNIPSITTSSGTAALHLALLALDIKPDDEIIVPTFTYVASVNAIKYLGAKPIFVDCDPQTWQINPIEIQKKITSKTKAVVVVHLYGGAALERDISVLCKKYNLKLIEDCAEAIGTFFYGQHIGQLSDVAVFSFFGNKTITTGEGGMVSSSNPEILHKIKKLKNQGLSKDKEYWHDILGYNYRMTNIQSAIGCAQLERIDDFLKKKKQIFNAYQNELKDLPLTFQSNYPESESSHWMISILVESEIERDNLRIFLKKQHIETRPLFPLVNEMPIYNTGENFPISKNISIRGMNLPSSPLDWENKTKIVIDKIKSFFNEAL